MLLAPAALTVLLALPLATPAPRQAAAPGEFERLWYDGQAEVSGYRWKGARYGEMRAGEAVAIFVTETVDAATHVKLEHPEQHRGETLTVLKLNLVRDFQTGLYDYDTMVTASARVDDFRPVRLAFSSSEWCGNVYEELDLGPRELVLDVRSYFEGESARRTLPARADGIVGDQLFTWLRGLRGPVLAPGERRTLPYLSDPFERRLRHAEARWGELVLARAPSTADLSVPAGTFLASEFALEASDGRSGKVWIEEAAPHRLLGWSWARGGELLDSAELTGSRRMKYWELHAEGEEALRAELGLDG